MKRRILQSFMILSIVISVLCAPLSAFAEVHDDIILNNPNHTKVAPDMHYILDDSKPYQMLFLGNDDIVSNGSSSQTMNLHNYQWLFVQTAGQPVEAGGDVSGRSLVVNDSDKSYSVYAAQADDETWTPIVVDGTLIDNLYIGSDSSGDWTSSIVASNFNLIDVLDNQVTESLSYFWYYTDNISGLDYNGNLTIGDHMITYIKEISHVFVRKFLAPFITYLISEPLFFVICLCGIVVTLVSFVYSFVRAFTSKNSILRRKGR